MSEERNDFAMSVARSAGTRGKKTNSREGETAKNDHDWNVRTRGKCCPV